MKRLGKFYMASVLLDSDETQEFARLAFGRCIIVRAEHLAVYGKFEYYAISPDFDEIEEGEKVPSYEAVFETEPRRAYFQRVTK